MSIKIMHTIDKYSLSGGILLDDKKYDYTLQRKSWNSCEFVMFNESDIPKLIEKIESGNVQIDPQTSVILARTSAKQKKVMGWGIQTALRK